MMNTLRITHSAFHTLRAHGEQTYPQECCGVLLGRITAEGWIVESAVPTSNICKDGAGSRYEIAPAELVGILRAARSRGLEIAGFYHSHPDHPPMWSPTDLAEAHWLGCCYLITEVARGKAAAARCFLLAGGLEEDKRFEELAIEVSAPLSPITDHA